MGSSTSFERGQFPSSCKLCNVETKLSWKCMDCDILMCNRCKETFHLNLRNSRNHRVIDIKEVGLTTDEVDFNNIPCKGHKGQVCVMFCKSCDQLVCTKCIAKIHNGHGLMEISEGYQIQIERLKDRQTKMKIKTKDNSKIKEIKKAETAKYMETKKKIQAQNISLKKEVDRCTEYLLKELDQTWETLLNSIEKEEGKVITLEKMERDIEDIIQSEDVEIIFEMNDELEASLEKGEEPLEFNFISVPSFILGEISKYHVGSLHHTSTDITLQVIKEYTTDISNVYLMSPCVDSLWISNEKVLQKVQPEVNNLKVISNFDIEISDMVVTPSNNLLLASRCESVLKQISASANKLTDSNYIVDPLRATAVPSANKLTDTNYSVEPLRTTAVHVTSDGKVVVGAKNFRKAFPATGRRVVISMDKEGRNRTVYEHDKYYQPIFTYPVSITSTHRSICVVDILSSDYRGRVVMLGQDGDIINIYTGHPDVNTKDNPFKPVSIATTPSDKIIVPNMHTHTLHILNNVGHLITHIYTGDIGIHFPYSIALSTIGKVYIGCTTRKDSTDKSKLYEVKLLD